MKKLLIVFLLFALPAFADSIRSCQKSGLTSGSPTNILKVNVPALTFGGGTLIYTIKATSAGGAMQTTTSVQAFSVMNNAGTITANLSTQEALSTLTTTGTITVALSQTNAAGVMTLIATPTVSGITANSIVFSVTVIFSEYADIGINCL